MRRAGDRVGADRLGDAGRGALEDGCGGLRRDVPGAEAGAAGRQDEARAVVDEVGDGGGDHLALVGHCAAGDVVAVGGEQLFEDVAASVLALALGDAVGDGEDGRRHARGSFVFSSRDTSPMTMSLSIALAMS